MNIFEFQWACKRCNACCKNLPQGVPILISDVEHLSLHLGLTTSSFVSKYCYFENVYDDENDVTIPLLKLKVPNQICVFFDGIGCEVHPAKPYYCQAAPVISHLFNNKETAQLFKEKCRGFGQGTLYTIDMIQEQLRVEEALEEQDAKFYDNGVQVLNLIPPTE